MIDATIPTAIIELGGKQHLVVPGAVIRVNRLENVPGSELTQPDLLSTNQVTLKIAEHLLSQKIRGLKFKNKVRYLRHYGHRQQLTKVEVLAIGQAKIEKTNQPAAKTAVKKLAAAKKIPTRKTKIKALEVTNG